MTEPAAEETRRIAKPLFVNHEALPGNGTAAGLEISFEAIPIASRRETHPSRVPTQARFDAPLRERSGLALKARMATPAEIGI